MTLAELKVECLRIIFANADEILSADKISQYEIDEQYSDYLSNMTGAINRCFAVLENKRVLPVKPIALEPPSTLASRHIRYDMDDVVDDFFDVDRVIGESDGAYYPALDYWMEGNTLVLWNNGLDVTVLYRPSLPRVRSTDNDMVLPIPDYIAAYIPYFIKGDIYRNDEPNEASEARNWFEQAISELEGKREQYQSVVDTVYSQTE